MFADSDAITNDIRFLRLAVVRMLGDFSTGNTLGRPGTTFTVHLLTKFHSERYCPYGAKFPGEKTPTSR
jgi:hypothetical protein